MYDRRAFVEEVNTNGRVEQHIRTLNSHTTIAMSLPVFSVYTIYVLLINYDASVSSATRAESFPSSGVLLTI